MITAWHRNVIQAICSVSWHNTSNSRYNLCLILIAQTTDDQNPAHKHIAPIYSTDSIFERLWHLISCSSYAWNWRKVLQNVEITSEITPQVESKKYNIIVNNDWKNKKCRCMPNVLALLSQPEKTYWSLHHSLKQLSLKYILASAKVEG